MAVTELTGAFSGSSTTPAVDVRTMLATQFAALGGNWAVVDNNYSNGTSVRSVITNTAGFAIMLVTSTTTTDTTLNIYIGQSYSTSTHTLSNLGFGAPSALASNSTGFSGGTYNPTQVFANNITPSFHYSYNYYAATSGQTTWNIVYDTTYAVIGIKDGTTSIGKWFYFGTADTLVANGALTDTYNFVLAQNWTGGTAGFVGAIIVNSLGNNSVTINHNGIPAPESNSGLIGAPGTNTYRDKYATDPTKTTASNIIVTRQSTDVKTATDPSTYGWKRFRLTNVIYTDGTGSAYGDTTQIGSNVYRYLGGVSNSVTNTTTGTLAGWVRIS
jgi:hypothetical protein